MGPDAFEVEGQFRAFGRMGVEVHAALLDHGRRRRVVFVLGLDLEYFVELDWVFFESLQLGLVIMDMPVLVLLLDKVVVVDDL